ADDRGAGTQVDMTGESAGELPSRADPLPAVLDEAAAGLAEAAGAAIADAAVRRRRPDHPISDVQLSAAHGCRAAVAEREDATDALVSEHQRRRHRPTPLNSRDIRVADRRELDRDQRVPCGESD